MTIDDYQRLALRTAIDSNGSLPPLWYLALGLCGEAGEVAELVKKHERHGKPFDADRVAYELGDVLWYLAVAAQAAGLTLTDVAERNVDKLRRRYPGGFVPAGGGADADRAAVERLVATFDATQNEAMDHFAGADKMVGDHPVDATDMTAPVTTDQPAPAAPRPMDDGVRCSEWGERGPQKLAYSRGYTGTKSPVAAVAFGDGVYLAWSSDDKEKARTETKPPTFESAKLAAEEWIRLRHPYFDADWPGRHGNPPVEGKP